MDDSRIMPLGGSRILIVEDEYYLADDVARALRDAGAQVVGPVASLSEAEQMLDRGGFDCAIVDMNLRGEMAFPIVDRLEEAGTPCLIATGYNSASLPDRFDDWPRVEKPFDPAKAVALLATLAPRPERSSLS